MKQSRLLILGTLSIFLAGLGLQDSWSQVAPSFPGALMQENQQNQNPLNKQPDNIETTPLSPLSGKNKNKANPTIENKTQKPNLGPSANTKIQVKKIVVDGVTLLDPKQVRQIVAPYEGKEATLTELQDNVADALTKLYENKGYVTSLVFIPPQEIKDGILHIHADEGTVQQVLYENSRFFKKYAVLPRIEPQPGDIFNLSDLERSMRRINENPDLTVQAILRAGDNPGQTIIDLKPVKDQNYIHLTPFIDNLGRPIIGNLRYGLTANDNNVLGLGDTAYSNIAFTQRSFGLINGYEAPLGSHGTKIGISESYEHFDFHSAGFEFNGHANNITPYLSQELYRSEHIVLKSELGLGVFNSTFNTSTVQNNQDRLRVLTPALQMLSYDRYGQTLVRNEVGLGLDIFGATRADSLSSSRPGAGSQFVRDTSIIVRQEKLPFGTYALLKGLVQLTPDKLVSLEQFQAGGASTVRGYQEGRLIGDSGAVLTAEWHIPIPFPESWVVPYSHYHLRNNIEFISFTDWGGVFDHGRTPGVNPLGASARAQAYLGSVGVGLRAHLTRLLSARLDLAFPLLQLAPENQTARIHFGVESRVF